MSLHDDYALGLQRNARSKQKHFFTSTARRNAFGRARSGPPAGNGFVFAARGLRRPRPAFAMPGAYLAEPRAYLGAAMRGGRARRVLRSRARPPRASFPTARGSNGAGRGFFCSF